MDKGLSVRDIPGAEALILGALFAAELVFNDEGHATVEDYIRRRYLAGDITRRTRKLDPGLEDIFGRTPTAAEADAFFAAVESERARLFAMLGAMRAETVRRARPGSATT